ncbi:hypothetical protein ACMTAS_0572 [Thermotoga neapolitana DSM 4359]|jgi:hypothetical protein|uniref:Uncharacterized protein n=1 Tax=Thermotoga neapolitana (strain ATCC 49049 / DSM 4359 / NBRC 107923 / NS-E) TaxID=309803 RepID=B9KB89_THENN|nr:Hypothetical Protein CTN_0109 [Thermotoga neapolitana DSM 4359]MDK2786260.1 hypothetical protein [Thermotoga sp.]MDK2949715.1 hypothetical protein [Thermotoga sp.]
MMKAIFLTDIENRKERILEYIIFTELNTDLKDSSYHVNGGGNL